MQLRYFKPSVLASQDVSIATLDLSSFMPTFLRTALKTFDNSEEEEEEGGGGGSGVLAEWVDVVVIVMVIIRLVGVV